MSQNSGGIKSPNTEQARIAQREIEIINNIKYKMNVKDPAVAKGLLDGFRSKGTFQTPVGFHFLASLERTIEHGKKNRTATVSIFLLSMVVVALGGLGVGYLTLQNTASVTRDDSRSKAIAESIVSDSAKPTLSSSISISSDSLTYLEAFPDADFREYVLSTVFGGSKSDNDIVSDADIAVMAAWTDSGFDTQNKSDIIGISYFIKFADVESDISSTDSSAPVDRTPSSQSTSGGNNPPSSTSSSDSVSSSSISSSSRQTSPVSSRGELSSSSTSSKSSSSSRDSSENESSTAEPETGTITFSYDVKSGVESGTYTGELVKGKPSGQGTFKSDDSDYTYTGEWKNGLPNGQGVAWIKVDSGIGFPPTYGTYRGDFSNGKPHGKGTFQGEISYDADNPPQESKFTFVGNWKNGFRNGTGTETYPNNFTVTGPFVNDIASGNFVISSTIEQPWGAAGDYDVERQNGVFGGDYIPRQ